MVSPSATALPWESVTNARTELVLVPSAFRLFGVTVSAMELTAPGTKFTDVEPDTPPVIAIIEADPTRGGLVRVAEATPFTVFTVEATRVPAVVENVTGVPSAISLLLLSFTAARMVVWDDPSATALVEPGVTVTEPIDAAAEIRVILTLPTDPLVDRALTVSVPAVPDAV